MKQKSNELNDGGRPVARHLPKLWWMPLFLVMVWTGCKQDAKVASDADPVGTYALVSVNGNKVPCPVQHEVNTLTVKSGSFTINADGTCGSKVVFSPPSGGDATREVKATYTRQASKLTMKWEGAGTTVGTIQGDTFTMDNEGMMFVYRK